MNSSKNFRINRYFPIVGLGLIASIYIGISKTPRGGLEFLWLLPLVYSLIILFMPSIIDYHKGGIGLKILYTIISIRYVISPVLITATKGEIGLNWIIPSIAGYKFAIAISILELLTCCSFIYFFWTKINKSILRQYSKNISSNQNTSLTFGGLVVISILIAIVLARGIEGVRDSFGFLLLNKKYETSYIDYYGITTIQVLKSFLFICIVTWSYKFYQKHNNAFWPLVALIAGFMNITTYFGYNRSLILQTAAASIFTLVIAFPKIKKSIFIVLTPAVLIVIYSLITIKQFGISAQPFRLQEVISLESITNTIESYVNGMWPLATSFDAANEMRNQVSFPTIIKDFVDNFFLFKVPGFTWPNNLLSQITSTISLYQYYTMPLKGAMLPLAGQMWFYGGNVFGLILTVLANILVIYLLVKIEIYSKLQKNIQSVFIYSWLASLFGLFMCYCLITLWWSFSKFAFFLIILVWINNQLLINQKRFAKG